MMLLDRLGDRRVDSRGRLDVDVAHLLERREVGLALEQALAGAALVEHVPSAKMSLRRSSGRPRTCSGDM